MRAIAYSQLHSQSARFDALLFSCLTPASNGLQYCQAWIPGALGQGPTERLLELRLLESCQTLWSPAHITTAAGIPLSAIQTDPALTVQRQSEQFQFGSLAAADDTRALRHYSLLTFRHSYSSAVSSTLLVSSSVVSASSGSVPWVFAASMNFAAFCWLIPGITTSSST